MAPSPSTISSPAATTCAPAPSSAPPAPPRRPSTRSRTPGSPSPWARGPSPATGGLHPWRRSWPGSPWWSRSPAAALRLSLAPRGRAGARSRFAGAHGSPEWRLDGFDFTHPITLGAPAVPIGPRAPVRRGGVGDRPEVVAHGPAGRSAPSPRDQQVGGRRNGGRRSPRGPRRSPTRGPALKDRVWFALFPEGEVLADAPIAPGPSASSAGR